MWQNGAYEWRKASLYVDVPMNTIILYSVIFSVPVSTGFYLHTTSIRSMMHCGSTMDNNGFAFVSNSMQLSMPLGADNYFIHVTTLLYDKQTVLCVMYRF